MVRLHLLHHQLLLQQLLVVEAAVQQLTAHQPGVSVVSYSSCYYRVSRATIDGVWVCRVGAGGGVDLWMVVVVVWTVVVVVVVWTVVVVVVRGAICAVGVAAVVVALPLPLHLFPWRSQRVRAPGRRAGSRKPLSR